MKNRWVALAIIFASFIQFTLNWFAIIPGFGGILGELKLSPVQLGGIVSAFIAGYGLFHLPGGMLAERFGVRAMMLLGVAVESAAALLSGVSHGYGVLIASRVLCGVGGSIYIGCAVGLTTAWFRDRYLATANGLITGVAFSLGAALGLFGWGALTGLIGWRAAVLAGAGVGGLTLLGLAFLYPHPPSGGDEADEAGRHSLASLRRVLATGRLWTMSLAFIGGYGAYFTATAWLPAYAVSRFGAGEAAAQGLGAVILLSGIVGSLVGGWLSDKLIGLKATFLLACAVEAVALAMVPFTPLAELWLPAAAIGAATIAAFVCWIGLPGLMPERLRSTDVPTAAGLMLTVVAIGGVAMPPVYAYLAGRYGAQLAWPAAAVCTLGFALIAATSSSRPGPQTAKLIPSTS